VDLLDEKSSKEQLLATPSTSVLLVRLAVVVEIVDSKPLSRHWTAGRAAM